VTTGPHSVSRVEGVRGVVGTPRRSKTLDDVDNAAGEKKCPLRIRRRRNNAISLRRIKPRANSRRRRRDKLSPLSGQV